MSNKTFLLDTHIWIWFSQSSPELSSKTIKIIDQAMQAGGIWIAAISVWEIAILVNKNRLLLQFPLEEWIQRALAPPEIELVPLTPSIAIESAQLPGSFHKDPSDRMIVATARIENLTLITRDENILTYSKQGFVEAVRG